MSLMRNDFFEGIFDRASYTYSSIGPNYFNYFGKRLVELSKTKKGDIVLDVAMGRGASLFPACETVGVVGKVIGVDFSEGMVIETKKVLGNKEMNNTEVFQMDAENLNFDEATFDNVICGLSIQFFSDYKKSINEMFRVLKLGGKVGISTWKKKEGKPGIIGEIASKYLPTTIQVRDKPNNQAYKPDFGDEQFLQSILSEVGFKNINIINERRMFYYHDCEEWWNEQWSHAGRVTFEMIDSQGNGQLERFKKEIFEKLEKEYGTEGIPLDANVLIAIAKK